MKRVKWAAVVLVSLYTAIVFSPIPRHVGRTNAPLAALFEPFSFNFGELYEDGEVYGITVGSTKEEVARQLADQFGLNTLSFCGHCGAGQKYARASDYLTFENKNDLFDWGKDRDVWIIFHKKEDTKTINTDMSLHLHFSNQILTGLELYKINFGI